MHKYEFIPYSFIFKKNCTIDFLRTLSMTTFILLFIIVFTLALLSLRIHADLIPTLKLDMAFMVLFYLSNPHKPLSRENVPFLATTISSHNFSLQRVLY